MRLGLSAPLVALALLAFATSALAGTTVNNTPGTLSVSRDAGVNDVAIDLSADGSS